MIAVFQDNAHLANFQSRSLNFSATATFAWELNCEKQRTQKHIVESFGRKVVLNLQKDTKMAKIDLSSYNLGELKGLEHEIQIEIKGREHQDLQKAREQILAIAQAAGISVDELLAKKTRKGPGKTGLKVKPQYRNPADNAQTWTGRGRPPKWLAEGVAGGKSLDDFRI